MSLGKLQKRFTLCVADLINYAHSRGYELTFGDAYRDPKVFGQVGEKKGYGSSKSCHKSRLAVDLNLFVDGDYITTGDHPAYVDLGEYWEAMNEHTAWGGRFNDANHFSFEYQGRK